MKTIPKLCFSEEVPTASGWYWVRHPSCPEQVQIERVVQRPGHKYLALTEVEGGCRQFYAVAQMRVEWAGPIPLPDDPT